MFSLHRRPSPLWHKADAVPQGPMRWSPTASAQAFEGWDAPPEEDASRIKLKNPTLTEGNRDGHFPSFIKLAKQQQQKKILIDISHG